MVNAALSVEDRTVYPVEEKVGEELLHRWIVELLRPLIERWLREQGQTCLVGADQFIYFEQYNAHRRVSPDVYVLPGVPSDTRVPSWKVWETGVVPSFALEVASLDWQKDYYSSPEAHAEMGTGELLVFDPHCTERREGRRWQRFAKAQQGRFELVEHTDADRIRSDVLGCYLRAVGVGQSLRLRLGLLPSGDELFPTGEEAERQAKEAERQAKEAERQAKEAERQAKEAERQAKEAERQAKEAERQAKEAALARLAELEMRLKERN